MQPLPKTPQIHLIVTQGNQVVGVITEIDAALTALIPKLAAVYANVPYTEDEIRPIVKGERELFPLGRDFYHVSREFVLGLTSLFTGLEWREEVMKLDQFFKEDMRFCFVIYS